MYGERKDSWSLAVSLLERLRQTTRSLYLEGCCSAASNGAEEKTKES
ncbi:MAG: hypothetical protein GQ556_05020 [Desulfobacterales bacterium]|nr:hypothetical protein [Desulfobacterales bacterium]